MEKSMKPKSIPELVALYEARDFNNFFDHLPGGRYRNRPQEKKLHDDLDKEAAKLGIDTRVIFEEMTRGHSKVWEAIRIMQQDASTTPDTPEVKKIAEEGNSIRQQAHKKLIPLFEAMVKLGYHPNKLVT